MKVGSAAACGLRETQNWLHSQQILEILQIFQKNWILWIICFTMDHGCFFKKNGIFFWLKIPRNWRPIQRRNWMIGCLCDEGGFFQLHGFFEALIWGAWRWDTGTPLDLRLVRILFEKTCPSEIPKISPKTVVLFPSLLKFLWGLFSLRSTSSR